MSIENLTPAEVRERCARYGIKATGRAGTTGDRVAVYVAFLVLALLASLLIFGFLFWLFGLNTSPYFQLGIFAGWILFAGVGTERFFLVSVPKITGLITTSYFGGWLHSYGPGWQLTFPWEWYRPDDFISLRAIVVKKASRFFIKQSVAKKSQKKGAVGMVFEWTVQYAPFLPLLALYVRTEERAIAEGFEEVIENALSEAILDKISLGEVLHKATLDQIQEALEHGIVVDTDHLGSTIEERFGIRAELNTLGPPEFDKDYTEALSGSVVHEVITRDARDMAKKLGMPGEKAMDTVMMLNKEAVNKTVFSLQMDENSKQAAGALGEALGPIAGAVAQGAQALNRRGRRGGQRGQGGQPPQTPQGGNT